MKTFLREYKTALIVAGLLLVLATAGISLPPAKADGSAPVTVVNTPLPVSLSGTGTIAGNVNAFQGGTWSVGVTSLPAVQLAAGTQLQTTSVDNPAKNAFAVKLCADDNCANPSAATIGAGGARYVIEQIAGSCNVRNTGIDGLELIVHLNGQDFNYPFRDRLSTDDDSFTTGLFFETTRIYGDGGVGNGLSAHILYNGTNFTHNGIGPSVTCNATLSGHIVP